MASGKNELSAPEGSAAAEFLKVDKIQGDDPVSIPKVNGDFKMTDEMLRLMQMDLRAAADRVAKRESERIREEMEISVVRRAPTQPYLRHDRRDRCDRIRKVDCYFVGGQLHGRVYRLGEDALTVQSPDGSDYNAYILPGMVLMVHERDGDRALKHVIERGFR